MTTVVLLTIFFAVAAYSIWSERHDELWDPMVEAYGICRRSHKGGVARPLWLVNRSNGEKSWLNGMHIQIDSEGIYLGYPKLVAYKGAVFLPWAETHLLPKERWVFRYRARFVIPSLDIVVRLPGRFVSELESNYGTATQR